jgi:hypothetical protein
MSEQEPTRAQEDSPQVEAEPTKFCRYCLEKIKSLAKVCHLCSRAQSPFINFLRNANLIISMTSIGLLAVAFLNFGLAREQLGRANDANSKAQEALAQSKEANLNAENALGEVLKARRDVLEVAQSVIEISAILPRTGGYGGGLTNEDMTILKKQLDFLRSKVGKSKQRP